MSICPHCSTPLNGGVCPSCGYVDPLIFVLKPGTKLQKGKYTVGKVLGQGGFGITYRGANQLLKSAVAIKEFFPEGCSRAQDGKTVIPNPNFAQDFNKWKQKFLKEAQILAKLNHPSIVKVLDYFEENNTAYMVMEFLKGQTLESYVQSKGGRLSEEEALKLIKQIAEAVKYIHSHNVLHRDLKPDNIILTDDGRVVLIDFGNAKDFNSSTLRTSSTTAVLTPGYGAPEQYSPKEEKGPYTDIYALGAILYRMLTGQIPTEADRRLREILNAGRDPLVPPRRLNSSIGENVEKVILKALNLRKKDRYQSVDEFLNDLNINSSFTKKSNHQTVIRGITNNSQTKTITKSRILFLVFIINLWISILVVYILSLLHLNFIPTGKYYVLLYTLCTSISFAFLIRFEKSIPGINLLSKFLDQKFGYSLYGFIIKHLIFIIITWFALPLEIFLLKLLLIIVKYILITWITIAIIGGIIMTLTEKK